MPHERVQQFVVIDYTKEISILAVIPQEEQEKIVGIGQYFIHENNHTAEVAFVVRDDYQNQGHRHGTPLLSHLSRQETGVAWIYCGSPHGETRHAPSL